MRAKEDGPLAPIPEVEAQVQVEAEAVQAAPVEALTGDEAVTVGELLDGAQRLAGSVRASAQRWVDRGRYRKLRVSRKGKPLLPDIPLAAVAAVEAATLAGAGWGRLLAAHLGAGLLVDVEVVNEADRFVQAGTDHLLDGDVERAEAALLKALSIDDHHAAGYLQLAALYRIQGAPERARPLLKRAIALDPAGDVGRKAGDLLRALD